MGSVNNQLIQIVAFHFLSNESLYPCSFNDQMVPSLIEYITDSSHIGVYIFTYVTTCRINFHKFTFSSFLLFNQLFLQLTNFLIPF